MTSSELQTTSSYPLLLASPSSYRRSLYLAILLILMGAGSVALVQQLNERRPPTSAAKPSDSNPLIPVEVSMQITRNSAGAQDLSGQWKLVNTIEKTSYRAFNNLEIGFRLLVEQTGTNLKAEGEKVSEDGLDLPASRRTPIHLTGSIEGETVKATFVEEGSRRKTTGRFVWKIENAGADLTGTFVSTAARASGISAASREF